MRKFTILIRYLFVFTIISTISVSVFAQSSKYSVAANWELYSVGDEKVSFKMPRLPVLNEEGDDQCRGEFTHDYYAYTNGAVFSVRITSKITPRAGCVGTKKFDEKSFGTRINELKQYLTVEKNSANNISKDSVIKLFAKDLVVKLVNDYDNKRWIELSVFGADEQRIDVRNFLDSLKFEKPTTGIEIGQGAEQVFGDDVSESIVEQKITNDQGITETIRRLLVKTDDTETRGIKVVKKPRSSYPKAARKKKTQGKVVLRVTFIASGGVGDISVVSGLENGLTEEAIKAVRKIAFLPAQRDGARYSVTKPVEYSFIVY